MFSGFRDFMPAVSCCHAQRIYRGTSAAVFRVMHDMGGEAPCVSATGFVIDVRRRRVIKGTCFAGMDSVACWSVAGGGSLHLYSAAHK